MQTTILSDNAVRYRFSDGSIKLCVYAGHTMRTKTFVTYEAYSAWKNRICYGTK